MDSVVLGPMMPCEASLLRYLIEVVRPNNVVEFGYFNGYSSEQILAGLGPNGRLTSYDIEPKPTVIQHPQFTFVHKNMRDYDSPNVVDFVLFDASHNLNDSTTAFLRMNLHPKAIIVVHDTGSWNANYFPDHRPLNRDLDGGFIHQPDEIKFVNWLKRHGWDVINLGTLVEPRHGLSILQRNQ